jgi:hypothetical protein
VVDGADEAGVVVTPLVVEVGGTVVVGAVVVGAVVVGEVVVGAVVVGEVVVGVGGVVVGATIVTGTVVVVEVGVVVVVTVAGWGSDRRIPPSAGVAPEARQAAALGQTTLETNPTWSGSACGVQVAPPSAVAITAAGPLCAVGSADAVRARRMSSRAVFTPLDLPWARRVAAKGDAPGPSRSSRTCTPSRTTPMDPNPSPAAKHNDPSGKHPMLP